MVYIVGVDNVKSVCLDRRSWDWMLMYKYPINSKIVNMKKYFSYVILYTYQGVANAKSVSIDRKSLDVYA